MKRYILILLLIADALIAPAQKLVIEGFKCSNGDLTASVNLRKDLNGDDCALVKVQLAAVGAKFEGNIVDPVLNKTDEYWVYLTRGSKQLVVKHPNYLPVNIEFSKYGINGLTAKTTYVLTLVKSAPVEKTQKLTIHYTPSNATVLVDSKFVNGNGLITLDLPLGAHNYVIAADGYSTSEGDIKLRYDSPSKLQIDLNNNENKESNFQQPNLSQIQNVIWKDSSNFIIVNIRGVSFKMIRVEGGMFTMGKTKEQSQTYKDEKPAHSVNLSSYYIGETEVTQALWTAVMGSNPSNFNGENKPVEQVSWDDCQTFISRLNSLTGKHFSLPTEAQWEYAARGGKNSQGNKYSGSCIIDGIAWYTGNSGNAIQNVGAKSANELGLYDMSGNVCEWCSDWYGKYSSESQTNPIGADSGSYRVFRGGSCFNIVKRCRVSYRDANPPGNRFYFIGLRLALVGL